MTKRKNKIKVKVSNNTTNTLIKVAGLGIVSYLAFKMLSNNENGLAYLGGSSSGYTGSGTDFSGLGLSDFLPFMQETPPTFVVNNPPLPTGFFTPSDTVIDTNKINNSGNIPELTNETKKEFTVKRVPETIVGNTTNSNLTNIFNPKFWFGSWGKELPEDEYTLRQQNYARFAIFKTPTDFINAGVNPLGFLINIFKSTSGSGGGGGGCSSGNCPKYDDNVSFTVDLSGNRTSNMFYTPSTPLINTNNNANINAQSFLTAMRQNIQSPTITYTKKAMTPMEYGDFFNKNLAQLEREAQNKMATSLASGNCSPAIATNQCSGTKKSVNYATAVAQTSERRYYENYGTPMTRSDLVYS
jgi:hypothetical protein